MTNHSADLNGSQSTPDTGRVIPFDDPTLAADIRPWLHAFDDKTRRFYMPKFVIPELRGMTGPILEACIKHRKPDEVIAKIIDQKPGLLNYCIDTEPGSFSDNLFQISNFFFFQAIQDHLSCL